MDIVEELRQNRESGAKRLVSEYKAGLLSIARRFYKNESDAEELVNITFAKVVENIDDYLEQSAFFAWMCQILTNEFKLSVRRKSNKMELYPGVMPEVEDEYAAAISEALREPFALGDGDFACVCSPDPAMWIVCSARLRLGHHLHRAATAEEPMPSEVKFCDYLSAGGMWSPGDYYRTWFPEEYNQFE